MSDEAKTASKAFRDVMERFTEEIQLASESLNRAEWKDAVDNLARMVVENARLRAELAAAVKRVEEMQAIAEEVARRFESDPHQFSTRPCSTCRDISESLGRSFGCVTKAAIRALKPTTESQT